MGAVWQQCCNCRRLYEGDFIGITKLPCQRLVARPWTLATPASTWLQAPQHSNGKRGNSDLKASSGSAASTLCSATSKDTQAAIHREHTTDISSQLRSNAHQGGVTRGTRQADTRAVTHSPAFARAGQPARRNTQARRRCGRCRLLFLLGVQHISSRPPRRTLRCLVERVGTLACASMCAREAGQAVQILNCR